MGKEYSITPVEVPHVQTAHRTIVTPLPHPDTVSTLESLRRLEPVSMRGMPPIVWEKAEDCSVYDAHGNRWLDWSSGVLVTNAGHGMPEVREAIIQQVQSGLLHHYVFPAVERATLVQKLVDLAPEGLDKVFLLTTGSEATECALKLSRAHGIKVGGNRKIGIIGFERGFHGRTLGAQQAGGMAGQKSWIVNEDPGIYQFPFPDGYWQQDVSFQCFLNTLKEKGLIPADIAGVMMESYQGVGPDFAPVPYVAELAAWCREHQIVLTFDEVQAGFGRTGKFWAFEHYGVTPDLICCGKGISSSLPLSAVIGRNNILDQFGPGSMTSTHSGNPVCCAAALAAIGIIEKRQLTQNAEKLGCVLEEGLLTLQKAHPEVIGYVSAKGLVGGIQVLKPGTKEPDHDRAHRVIEKCYQKGLLLFAPVGAWGQTIKIAPPLTITHEALVEGLEVMAEAFKESV